MKKDKSYLGNKNYPNKNPYEKSGHIVDTKKSDKEKVEKLRASCDGRIQGMYSDRYSFWTHWREVSDVLMPRRYKWFITPNLATRGSPINQRILDTTVIKAHRDAAAGMMAGITSPARPWFRLSIGNMQPDDFSPERLWLSECERRMFKVFAKSNFYTSMHTVYEDLLAFGTAPMLINEDPKTVIRCFNPCAGEYFVANSDRLEIDVFARRFTMTARTIVQWFGKENCSQTVLSLFDSPSSGNQEREIILGHVIEPYDPEKHGFWPGLRDKQFIEVYWEYGISEDKLLQVKGYYEEPLICPRWYLVSNDSYGRSPGMDALGEMKQLMVEQRRKAQGIDKMVNPPLRAHVSLRNQPTSTLPGALTYVNSVEASNGIAPIYTVDPKLQDMKEDIREVQDRIKKIFFADVFQMLSQYEPKSGVSATEMAGRQQEQMLMMGPMLERFQNEALSPAISRTFNVMARAKLFPPAPPSIRGRTIEVEYISILAQAQKSVSTTAVERFSAQIGSWAAVKPDVIDNVDFDEMVEEYGDALVVNPKVIVEKRRVEAIRAQRNQQQQQQMMMQNSLAAAQGAKTLSQATTGSGQNALDLMLGQGGAQQ